MASKTMDTGPPSKHLKQGAEKILRNAEEVANIGVFAHFRDLEEPTVEVTPQLLEINFYAGDWALRSEEYSPGTALSRKADELRHEKKVGCYDVFKNGENRARCILFTGAPGSGKTTILNRLARDVIQKKVPTLQDVDMVHVVNCKDFEATDEMTPPDFLFRNMNEMMNEEEGVANYVWMKNNQSKVMFFIDSLDTLPYTLDDVVGKIGYGDRSHPANILHSLLSGDIFPHSRIVTSSREHTIRNYKGRLRPSKVIGLAGLSEESMREFIYGLLDDRKGREMWEYMTVVSPSVFNLCTTPVFLTFTLIGFLQNSSFKPSTMSGIMVNLLQSLIHTKHAHEEEILDVLNKLMSFAFIGTEERRVLFRKDELKKCSLTLDQVNDLIISVPGVRRGSYSQKVFEGRHLLFFCHQSIQESLTAMHVMRKDRKDFCCFLNGRLHEPHWKVVRRILCGLLLNKDCFAEASLHLLQDIEDVEAKRSLLKNHLKTALAKVKNKVDLLEVLIALHESGDDVKDIIESSIHEINLWNVFLTRSDMHALAKVIFHCEHLKELKLLGCNLNPTTVPVLANGIIGSNVTITRLDGSFCNILKGGIYSLGQIVRQCRVDDFDIKDSNLTSQQMQQLESSLMDAALKKFVISGNQNIGVGGAASLAKICSNCQLTELDMEGCNFGAKQMKEFESCLRDTKLKTFIVNRNRNLRQDGIEALGTVVRKFGIENLHARGCEFTAEELACLHQALGEAKVKILDVSEPQFMNRVKRTDDVTHIANLASHVEDRLLLYGWDLDFSEIQTIKDSLMKHGLHNTLVKFGESGAKRVFGVNVSPFLESMTPARGRGFLPSSENEDQGTCEEIMENEEMSNRTCAVIGPEGGCMELNDFRITFPAGAVTETKLMKMELFVNKFDALDDYFPISPVLHCSPNGLYLYNAARIQLPTKFYTDDEEVLAHIMLKEEEGHPWQIIESVPLANVHNVVEFQCSRFTWFTLVVDYIYSWFRKVSVTLASSLHYDFLGNFTFAVYYDDETSKKHCLENLESRRYRCSPANINKVTAKLGDLIEIELECDDNCPSNFVPVTDGENVFRVSENFIKSWKMYLSNFELKPLPTQNIRVLWRILQNKSEATRSSCILQWPLPDPDSQERSQTSQASKEENANPQRTQAPVSQSADVLINSVEHLSLHVEGRTFSIPSLESVPAIQFSKEEEKDRKEKVPEEID